MKKIALIYGSISGAIVIVTMIIGYMAVDGKGFGASQVFGFAIMFIALSMIFFGIKKYRDAELGGVIRFWPAFGLGVMIAGVAGIIYIIGWEINLALTDYRFIDDYVATIMDAKKAGGASEAELAALAEKMEGMKANYAKPLYRIPMTFTEIFPVGALIALISAAFLRNPKVLPARA